MDYGEPVSTRILFVLKCNFSPDGVVKFVFGACYSPLGGHLLSLGLTDATRQNCGLVHCRVRNISSKCVFFVFLGLKISFFSGGGAEIIILAPCRVHRTAFL